MNSFAIILGAIAFCFATFSFAKEKKGPVAVFEETVRNFGTVSRISSVEYTFHLKNEGDATLRIEKISLDCDCTDVKYSSKIKPGKTGYVTLSTSGYDTEVKTYAIVTTNEPTGKNKHRLYLIAHFLGPLDIKPGFSIQFEGDPLPKSREVTIRNYDPVNPLDIFDIKLDPKSAEYIDATYQTIETGREYVLRFELKVVPPPGTRFHGSASVRTTRGTGHRYYLFSIYVAAPTE